MKIQFKIAFLIIFLAGCVPSPAIPVDAQNTAMAVVQTYIALTQTALPTPTVIPTATPQATLIPTLPPPPILTPDAIQVERWREYQTELAKVVLSFKRAGLEYDPEIARDALCEWDILGRAGQEVYVYVVCVFPRGNGDMRNPAIIYLESDGSIRLVKHPEPKVTNSSMFNYDPFPVEVQEKFCHYFSFPSDFFSCPYVGTDPRPRLDMLYAHIEYRKTHPEEPPLVVLSSTATYESTVTPVYPTPSPLPTQPLISIFTPDVIQIERWREYQTELAKKLVSKFPVDIVLCEWDILGRSEQEVYVWAVCAAPGYVASRPAVIYLKTDGSIQAVEIAVNGSTWDSDIQRLFPEDVQEKIASGIFLQRSAELKNHIEWRRTYLEEPPLIILSAMPALTSTP